MDKIIIEGLSLNTIIGVYPFERQNEQRVLVDLTLSFPLQAAGHSDNVADTIDYAAVAQVVAETADELRPHLLEKLADEVCRRLFLRFPLEGIEIKVCKPDILPDAHNVGIQIYRDRTWANGGKVAGY